MTCAVDFDDLRPDRVVTWSFDQRLIEYYRRRALDPEAAKDWAFRVTVAVMRFKEPTPSDG